MAQLYPFLTPSRVVKFYVRPSSLVPRVVRSNKPLENFEKHLQLCFLHCSKNELWFMNVYERFDDYQEQEKYF